MKYVITKTVEADSVESLLMYENTPNVLDIKIAPAEGEQVHKPRLRNHYKDIVDFMKQNNGMSSSEIAESLGQNPSTVMNRIKRLEKMGYLARTPGRRKDYTIIKVFK